MKKSYLPLLLIAGAAIAFYAFRRRPRVSVEAGPTEKISEEEFTAPVEIAPARPSAVDIGTKLVSSLFTKKGTQAQAAAKATRTAVKRAVKSRTATRQQAQAAARALAKGIRIKGFNDNSVLV
jgi:hypothetical protein